MKTILFLLVILSSNLLFGQSNIVVMQTDFGLKDGAVAAMKGVTMEVSREIKIFDLTHEIPAYNIWEASYRLNQTAAYWPKGTVFVSVVDPGVGSSRKSIVMKSKSGHFFVTPDNGTLTHVSESLGVEEVRIIDEAVNRLKNSQASYTFHGRDVYAYTAARLAAGVITFEQVGGKINDQLVLLPYQKASVTNGVVKGTIDILDVQYGNVWTNISHDLIEKAGMKYGDTVEVKIFNGGRQVMKSKILFGRTFADVKEKQVVAYLNSMMNFSVAVRQGNFAQRFNVSSGPQWTIEILKAT